jgi:hypothetical protein
LTKLFSSGFAGGFLQTAYISYFTGNPQEPWRGGVERCLSGKCSGIIDRREVQRLVIVTPIDNPFESELDNRSLT